jgi:hypothetical protein
MQLQELLDSKIYVKPNGGMTFKTPDEYLSPFIDMVSPFTTDFRIAVDAESRNANEDSTENVAYGRVVVEAKLPQAYTSLDHDTVIGIIYALDTQKPVIKAYTGQVAWACTNLSIFNADNIFEASLLANTNAVYDKLKRYTGKLNEGLEEWINIVNNLKTVEYNENALNEKIGYMLRKSQKQNFTTAVIAATKDLDNAKSVYAVKGGTTDVTQYITDKVSIVEKPDRTLFAGSLFEPELLTFNNN